MRLSLILSVAGLGLSVLIWWLSGGRAFVLLLPLMFGLPMLFRRRQ